MTVTSFTPAQTSPGGGITATIVGSGFPTAMNDDLSVVVCGNDVTAFTSVVNKQIVFTIPPQVTTCSGTNNQISYGGQTTTFTFTYNPSIAPQISSLSKTTSSPILKSTITITGTNFNTGTTTVFLIQNGAKKY